ncbi:uncharacterized protein LOC104853955 isoform X5 [Fukomys damarensis]|uniref:uncharacterized protein LOC104853955 isoform X5 n=1 Tax=Fukomys damarensis TaxID=885580 RepID=UPI00053F6DC1|nr:uncharacterized protein LOC104853955 isoform X5 [Fukomys damarensis]
MKRFLNSLPVGSGYLLSYVVSGTPSSLAGWQPLRYYKITHVKGALGMEIGCPLPGAAQRTAATLALSWTPESVYTPCTTPRLSSHAVTHTGILSAVESGTYFCSLMCCVNFRCPCMHIVPRNPRDLPAGPDLGSAQYRRRATSQGQPRIRRGAAHRG